MITLNIETGIKTFANRHHEQRITRCRRLSQGRRKMIRFDATGGDRRSGYARRKTDVGFDIDFLKRQEAG